MWVRSLSQEDSLEEEMPTHSNILARIIPWTEDPGRLQFMELQRVRLDWATEHARMHMPSLLTPRKVFFFFNHKGILILLNAFSASIEMIIWFLSLILLMWCILLTDLQILNNSCFPGGSVVRNLLANAGDTGLIPGLGRSSAMGNGNLLQYSYLANPMDRGGAYWATPIGSQRVRRTERTSMHAWTILAFLEKNPTDHAVWSF